LGGGGGGGSYISQSFQMYSLVLRVANALGT
jgi:hypothetical protein